MIELQTLKAGYGRGKDFVAAVDNVSLTVNDNEILGIAGESGCGKSTLMRSLYGDFSSGLAMAGGSIKARFSDPDSGRTIERDGAGLKDLWWDAISYVPQGSMSVLNPVMRVGPQVLDALPKRERKGSAKELRNRLAKFLEGLGLPESVLDAYPHQLSGGMGGSRILSFWSAMISAFTSRSPTELRSPMQANWSKWAPPPKSSRRLSTHTPKR
jgi:peptide/nickel transport system ATP-binding protein